MTDTDLKIKIKSVSSGIKIELNKENSELLKSLLDEANSIVRGGNLSFTKLGNWLFAQHSSHFSEEQRVSLKQAFHKERAFVLWMANEMERAEREGREPPTIEELLKEKPLFTSRPTVRKIRRTKIFSVSEKVGSDAATRPSETRADDPELIEKDDHSGASV